MKEVIEGLKSLVENPDDLSTIPNMVAKLEEYQRKHSELETDYQEKINSLQQVNRNLLAQIPVTQEESKDEEQEEKEVTFEEAREALLQAMNNVGGNGNA